VSGRFWDIGQVRTRNFNWLPFTPPPLCSPSPVLHGAYALVEYDLAYEPLRSMKGHVVVNFIVDHAIDLDHSVDVIQLKPWGLYFDGSICSKGQ
jgi:hypothetical protein